MNIVLNGSVAVGKSTLMKRLLEIMPEIFVFPEFIDENLILSTEEERTESLNLLNERFNGNLNPYVLQDHILKRWEDYSERSKTIDRSRPRLFERLPDDSVEVFAKPIVTDDEYTQLQLHLVRVNRTLPSYHSMKGENTIWIDYHNHFTEKSVREVADLVKKYSTSMKNCVINIMNDHNYENYIRRGRTEEKYTPDSMSDLNERYAVYLNSIKQEIKPVKEFFVE